MLLTDNNCICPFLWLAKVTQLTSYFQSFEAPMMASKHMTPPVTLGGRHYCAAFL